MATRLPLSVIQQKIGSFNNLGLTPIALDSTGTKPLDSRWQETTHASAITDFKDATDNYSLGFKVGVRTGKDFHLCVVEFINCDQPGARNGVTFLKDYLWPSIQSLDDSDRPLTAVTISGNLYWWCLYLDQPDAPNPATTIGVNINNVGYNINIHTENSYVPAPLSDCRFVRNDGKYDRNLAVPTDEAFLGFIKYVPEVLTNLLNTGLVPFRTSQPIPIMIENVPAPAKTQAKITDLVELINPARGKTKEGLEAVLWSITKALRRMGDYKDLAHQFAIKAGALSEPNNYSVTFTENIIKQAYKQSSEYNQKYLQSLAESDDKAGYQTWVQTYLTEKARTKEEKRQAEEDQTLNHREQAEVLIDAIGGDTNFKYIDSNWWCWTGQAGRGQRGDKTLLWVQIKDESMVRASMRPQYEAELQSRGFTKEKIAYYTTEGRMASLMGDLKLACFEDSLPASPDWVLPISNGGAWEFKTGEVRERTQTDYFISESKVDKNLVTAPGLTRVKDFFHGISYGQGDDFEDWLTCQILYCLSGELNSSRHNMLCFEGFTQNGKSTILSTVKAVLGGYGGDLPPSILFDRDDQGRAHDTALLQLKGKRCVVYSELGKAKVNEATVKRITGGDEITGRIAKADNFLEFDNRAKLLTAANCRLNLTFDEAITRRVVCIEIQAKFVDQPNPEREEEFPRTDIKEWLVTPQGQSCFVAYLIEHGQAGRVLPLPEGIKRTADTNLEDSKENHMIFFREALVFDPAGKVKIDLILRNYTGWLQVKNRDATEELRPTISGKTATRELKRWQGERVHHRTTKDGCFYRVRFINQYTE